MDSILWFYFVLSYHILFDLVSISSFFIPSLFTCSFLIFSHLPLLSLFYFVIWYNIKTSPIYFKVCNTVWPTD